MPRHIRSNAVAYVALFVALSGTSYAAIQIPKNSVGAKQLRTGAVTNKKLRANAVTTSKVRNGSLLAKDFKAGSLPAGKDGDRGLTGPPGQTGPPGPATMASITATGPESIPSATPEATLATHAIITETSGALFVYGHISANTTCSAGTAQVGIYVDGAPVPGTGRVYDSGVTTRLDFTGVLSGVAGGLHHVTISVDCTGGAENTTATTEGAVGAASVIEP